MLSEEKLKRIHREEESEETAVEQYVPAEEKRSKGFHLILCQMLLSILLAAVLFAVSLFMPETYEQIKSYYFSQGSVFAGGDPGVSIIEE